MSYIAIPIIGRTVPFLVKLPNCSPKPYTSSPGDVFRSEFMYRTYSGLGSGLGLELKSVFRQELFEAEAKVHL